MALRAGLSAPRQERDDWPWHQAKWTALSASLLMGGDRRMEAENYLAGGYGIRLAMEARKAGWTNMGKLAKVWQPLRLKGIQVSREFGTPFLAATQVFDLRPVPRKFLSLDRTNNAANRFVTPGMILVTCSGSVGRATLASKPHEGVLISHDLLRVEPQQEKLWGWLYAYLRAPQTRAMMTSAQYGHIIKHLEVSHLNALPMPVLRDELLDNFRSRVQSLLDKRNRAVHLQDEAERLFSDAIGEVQLCENPEIGFTVRASQVFAQRRRLEGGYWTPAATAILRRFHDLGLKVESLSDVSERVWWMTCSGQVYGLNGSVALMTKQHEQAFFSHDLVRIVPKQDAIWPGYLFTVLGHPQLGRPLVIRNAYGTSIPHLDPSDVAAIPVVRLSPMLEDKIADRMEESVKLRADADELENELAADAEAIIDRFMAGDMQDVVVAP